MKRLFLSVLLLILSVYMTVGQELSSEVRAVYEACLSLRAAAYGSEIQLSNANERLKDCSFGYFGTFSRIDRESVSLNGHFIFDTEVVDSLIENRKVFEFAQRYHEKRRGSARISDAKVLTRNNCVKAKGTAKFRFLSNGRQELVLVTEPNGMVNMKVYDCMNNIWHNDDDALDTGKPHHVRIFDIPGGNTQIEVEVINKTDKDVSFVVITNR